MKKIFAFALCMTLAVGSVHAQQVKDHEPTTKQNVLSETELTDVVLFTNGRAEKGVVLEMSSGQPVRIIQADGVVHAYSAALVDRIIRGCGVEILHTAAPAANEPVESHDDSAGYDEETHAGRAPRRAAARPAARRPLRGAQPVAPHRAHAAGAARLRPARRAAEVEARPRAQRAAKAGAAARHRAVRGAKRR